MKIPMRFLVVLVAALVQVQVHAQALRPLHVSPEGNILDDSNRPVLLRGLNRSGTGSGNADATATDADYATQNKLLSMNLVRLFVNAAWWTGNVQVPIANVPYQTYIDQLIQRAKKYGDYVLIVKAGQFPDPPCGASGVNCPAPNQGDLNCQKTASLCPAQDTSGTYIDTAFTFWTGFAKNYGSDPAVLYDTWEDMHGIDANTWSDGQNQLIAAIRDYSPNSLIFVEDVGTAFDSIAAGAQPDLVWSNLVWNFHLYNASTAGCTEPASPRYANWPQKMDALVSFAQTNGHAASITEWGGCNDSEPYHTNISSYAMTHSMALAYFDSGNLISSGQLTATGTKVAQVYTAIAAGTSATSPVITLVANAEGEVPVIAPNTWVEIKGTNLAPAGDSSPDCAPGRCWQGYDFFASQMPNQLDGVSATVNGKSAFVYYISPTQVNILTPPDPMLGPVQVQLTNNGLVSANATVPSQALAPSLFVFAGGYAAARHADFSLLGPPSMSVPGFTFTPAKPGETILIYGNGFGPTSTPVISGSQTQGGTLSPLPVVKIGNVTATVIFAGLVLPGEFQFNVVVPASLANGDQPISVTYNGLTTQPGTLLSVHN